MPSITDENLPTVLPAMLPVAEARTLFADWRAASPIVRGLFGPLIIRHGDVNELLRDRRLRGPGMDLARLSGIPEGSRTWQRTAQILLFMEGDDHHRLRRLVSKAFTPTAVESLRPTTRATISALVDQIEGGGRGDAVAQLCNPFPIPVICALIGVEPDRINDMSRWASSILLALRLDAGEHFDEIEHAHQELDSYIAELIAQRRESPRDDLLSRLIAIEEEGERLSESELFSVVSMMLVAGTDTTRNQLACMIHTFAEQPEAWALLRDQPDLVANAVEEAIRWEPATEGIPRFTTEDIVVDGCEIPAGTLVVLLSMSANHDTGALPAADQFDIQRTTPNGWHLLTFGGGIHYCLGASLARLELVEALSELSQRFATLRLDGEAIANPPGSVIQGYSALPIAWT
jgi:cytochrome P450